MELGRHWKKLMQKAGKYKYAFLILCLGLVLMLFPNGKKNEEKEIAQVQAVTESSQDISKQLSEILSNVAGAGKTQVMLSVHQGEKTIYQSNTDTSEINQNKDSRNQTVTVTDAERNQTGLIQQINPPTYLGAIVLCQGGDVPSVRLAIVDAVSKVTGLGANQISVLKMK